MSVETADKIIELNRQWLDVMKRLCCARTALSVPKLKPKIFADKQYEKVLPKLTSKFPDFPEVEKVNIKEKKLII